MSHPPETLIPILTALDSAISPNQTLRDSALSQLQSWATIPHYYSSLIEILANKQLELGPTAHQIRLQAVVQFKNGLDKYWRKTATNVIAPEEKAIIRPRLLALVDEPDRVLAKNIALCISKIARMDFGTDWNELPSTLLASLHHGLQLFSTSPPYASLILHRTLLYLHTTIKNLSSNRMPKGRMLMSELAKSLLPPLRQLHEQMLNVGMERLRKEGLPDENRANETKGNVEELELSLLAFKSLTKLLVYGYPRPDEVEEPKAFFISTLPSFSALLSLRLSLLSSSPTPIAPSNILSLLTRQTISFGKLYRLLFNHTPPAFLGMNVAAPLIEVYWTAVQGAATSGEAPPDADDEQSTLLYPPHLIVQSLLLLSSTLGTWASSSSVPASALPPNFIEHFVQILVSRFMLLSSKDLSRWEEEPEEWINEEEAERWEFELRPCAERVLRDLVSAYKEQLGPSLAGMLQSTAAPQDLQGLLLKEAVYTAFSRCPSELAPSINFNQWLETTLIPEASSQDPNYSLVVRRIAQLLGSWVGEDLPSPTRSTIYRTLVGLLSSPSLPVRLTSAKALSKCDTWDFDTNAFLPFLESAVERLVALLGEVELADTMMRINLTLGVIVDRVGVHIAPFAPRLAQILAQLWSQAQETHFQTSVLVTFTRLAEALEDQSQDFHTQAGPIIANSCDSSLPAHVYLQEDGLELWQILLKRSSTLSPEMAGLLPLLVALLSAGTDVLPRCLKILESYLLLDAAQVLAGYSSALFGAIETLMGDLKPEAVKQILHATNTIFQVAPVETWAAALDQSMLLIKLLSPLAVEQTATLTVTKHLCTLSRIVLAGPETFYQLVLATAARSGTPEDQILSILLDSLVEKIDYMSQGGQRKLVALALASLLPTTKPMVLDSLGDMVSTWSSVLAQTEENEQGDAELYSVPEDYQSDIDADYTDTLESKRRQALSSIDPVRTLNLRSFIRQQLGKAQELNGGAEAFQRDWLSRVDQVVLEELGQRLDGKLAG